MTAARLPLRRPAGSEAACWYWEDFIPGRVVLSGPTVITADCLARFADLTGDHNPAHAGTGPVLVHGMLGLSIAIGLIEQTGVHHGSTVAMLEISSWSFRRPVHVGDVVRARMTIAGATPTRNSERGVVVRHLALLGQDDLVRQEGMMTLLVRRRPAQR